MKHFVAEFVCNKKLHPIEHAVVFHLIFESIHPFVDVNDQTGQLILNLILMQAGYAPITISLTDLTNYQNSFQTYLQYGNIDEMISFITKKLI